MSSEIRQVIENSHLFSGLDPGLIKDIAASATKKTLGANELLFQKGDRADALWGVLSGRIVIRVRANDGKEMVLDEFLAGDVFGEVGMLDFGPRRVEAAAVCKSELFRLERSHFFGLLQTNPELCFRIFALLCGHLRDTTETLEDTALYKLPSRLAKRLLLMSNTKTSDDGYAELNVVQSDLASMMGVHREAVNRQLREWEKSGWISIQRQRIKILDEKSLVDFAPPSQSVDPKSWGNDNLSRMLPITFPTQHQTGTEPVQPEKRFAAILAVSCAEYAVLLTTDSVKAIKRIKTGLAAIDKAITDYGGRLIWSAGERSLAEFPNGASAMEAALKIQKNAGLKDSDAVEADPVFRIGIHSGEVIASDSQIIGEPVNTAIRLTELSGSGGVCLSKEVRDELDDTSRLQLQYLGQHDLKNVADPIGVYSARSIPWLKRIALWASTLVPRRYRPQLVITLAVLVIISTWLGGQRFKEDQASSPHTQSIAVLPFTLEGNPQNTYLADGLAEEIRIALAGMPETLVIGRKSSDYFENWNATSQEIGEILQVAYILHGSVGLTGDELKVSSSLVETGNGTEVWRHNYQGSRQQFSEFQADIVRLANTTLAGGVVGNQSGVRAPPVSDNPEAYQLYLQARTLIREKTKASLVEALTKLENALEMDPDFASAHLAIADTYLELVWFSDFYQDDWLQESRALAKPHLDKAIAINANLAEAYLLQGELVAYSDSKQEESAYRKAISLNPNLAKAQMALGVRLCNQLRSLNDCLPYLEKAFEIDPLSVEAAYILALFLAYIPQRKDEHLTILSNLKARYPDHPDVKYLEVRLLLTEGRLSDAVSILEEVIGRDPNAIAANHLLNAVWYSLGETDRALESPVWQSHWRFVLSPDREETLRQMRDFDEAPVEKGGLKAYIYVMLREWQLAVDALSEHSHSLDDFMENHAMMLGKPYSPALSLATAYKALGDERYREFIKLEKNAVDIRWANDGYHNVVYVKNMARLYALEGRSHQAMIKLEHLITMTWNDPRDLMHPAFDDMRELPGFKRLQNLQRQRINLEREKLGLALIHGE